jgi:NAD(P)-dependent dehydrogenase (short-subunit alcohol dehydrogenase family)
MHVQPVALVTGGNRGIGREIGRQLGARGYHVLLGARDPARGLVVARELGLAVPPLDVSDPASIARLVHSLDGRKLGIDVLVHNAGVALNGFDARVARDTLAVNFFAVLRTSPTALLPYLRPHARVVIVSSGLGDRSALAPALRARFADGALDRASSPSSCKPSSPPSPTATTAPTAGPPPPTPSPRSAPPCSPRSSPASSPTTPASSASTPCAPAG